MSNSQWHSDQAIGEKAMRERRRVSVGFFIRRKYHNIGEWSGKTLSAHSHQLYETREMAQVALDRAHDLDIRFVYDIAEAFMIIDEKTHPDGAE